jgi:predicted AAA+ superfamily ATPase
MCKLGFYRYLCCVLKDWFMAYYRNIEQKLMAWKVSSYRKPLVLRGARQVGKTTVVDEFAGNFSQYIKLNLETEDRHFFEEQNNIDRLVDMLFFEKDCLKEDSDTLIFIDEIQEVPAALNMLRYFYEKYPQYYVIAAGSLLESLFERGISFPVGRVEYIYMYPFTFEEFLEAMGERNALKAYRTIPIPEYAEEKLLLLFHTYTLIGGMPEAVSRYVQTKDIVQLKPIYDTLFLSYLDDVEKYARNENMIQVLRHVIRASFLEAGERIKFAGFGQSAYTSREVGEAMRTLEKALLLHLTYPTTQTTLPFQPDIKKSPRLQVLDVGMLNFFSNIQREIFTATDLNNLYKGRVSEQVVGQEIIATTDNYMHPLLFWVREKGTSNSELDFLVQTPYGMIPVEVKSGAKGHLKSLLIYQDLAKSPLAVRLYSGRFFMEKVVTPAGFEFTLMNLPYSLTGKLQEYVLYFFQAL